jgi:signal transduction histidine kinase
VLIRYFIAIPAAFFATWAMVLQRRDFIARGMEYPARDIGRAAVALFLYGVIGQIFTKPSFLLPSTVINADLFQQVVGIPVEVFRAVFAVLVAFFVIRALRAFEIERQQRFIAAIEATSIAQQKTLATQEAAQKEMKALNEELKAREALRGELLHQVVTAQEVERQRIARELHDGVGQTLTALGMGLAAASTTVQTNPEVGARQLIALKEMSTQLTQEMSRIMAGLRPSSLTDLGLIPALRSQIQAFEKQSGATVNFVVDGNVERIKPELETIIFRITQESLNNIVKHAEAERVTVRVGFNDEDVHLMIKDDGRGFDTDEALRPDPQNRWGLIGIQERVRIVRGDCTINSETDEGTIIRACIPLHDGVCQCLQ